MGDALPYEPAAVAHHQEGTRAQKLAWILYDAANSGFGLIITGPLFSPYFVRALLPERPGLTPGPGGEAAHGLNVFGVDMPGDAVWGLLTAASALLVAIAAPILGAVADIRGWTKRLLVIHALGGSLFTLLSLGLAPGRWELGAVMFVLSSYCFGTSITFYNAFLPRLTPPERQGRLSGWGFAVGYVGGAIALIIALILFKTIGSMPLALAFAGLWWLLLSLPAILLLDEYPPQPGAAAADDRGSLLLAGFRRIRGTFRNIRQYKMLFLFLAAFLIYTNGTDTVINISPAFAGTLLNMSETQLIGTFLIVQFVAFGGASVFGYLADRWGNKPVIISNLVVWVLVVSAVALVQTWWQFMILAALIGLVLGGVQSSSRALMAKLTPEHIRNEAFGFFSLSGKALSVFGPLIYSALSTFMGTRYGVLAVIPFLVIGLVLVLFVQEPRRSVSAQSD